MEYIKLNPLVKKYYLIISVIICAIYIFVAIVLHLLGVQLGDVDFVSRMYMIAFLFLGLIGMLIDESIRKHPGLIMSFGLPVYSLTYIILMTLFGNNYPFSAIVIALYLIYLSSSFLVYKFVYPKLFFFKKGIVVFDTILMFLVNITTLIVGFQCAMIF